jgi:hypothetical protein
VFKLSGFAILLMVAASQGQWQDVNTHLPQSTKVNDRRLPRLSGKEIEKLLPGEDITYQTERWGPINIYPVPVEHFFSDGRLSVRMDRASLVGRWRIRGDLLCISGPPVSTGCRKVYASGNTIAVQLFEEGYTRTYVGTLSRR